jgi:hypothetical protein
LYAFVWTRFVRRAPLFTPIAVETIIKQELPVGTQAAEPLHQRQSSAP